MFNFCGCIPQPLHTGLQQMIPTMCNALPSLKVKLSLPVRCVYDGSCSAEQFWFRVTLLVLVAHGMCPTMPPKPRMGGLARGGRSSALPLPCSGHGRESRTQSMLSTRPGMDWCWAPVGATRLLCKPIPAPGSVLLGRCHAQLATRPCSPLCFYPSFSSNPPLLLACWDAGCGCGPMRHVSACVKPHKPEPDPTASEGTDQGTDHLQCAGCSN